MSVPGDQSPIERAKERSFVLSRSTSHASGSEAKRQASLSSLPLRLSVARGGLGVELCRPVEFDSVIVEEFDVALCDITYPVDLSLGVKRFRNRRSVLRHCRVVFDLPSLSETWAELAQTVWGEALQIRLKGSYGAVHGSCGGSQRNDGGRLEALSVTAFSQSGALAFDLVVTSGKNPRLVVASPRAVGDFTFFQGKTALGLSLQLMDVVLLGVQSILPMRRKGRSVELVGVAQAITLALFPSFGFRLPSVENHVVSEIELREGKLALVLGQFSEPFAAGPRALSVASSAQFEQAADDTLALGDHSLSRRLYLDALATVPEHPEVLQDLAELDLAHQSHGESAISFLETLEGSDARVANLESSRFQILLSRALRMTGRNELALDALKRAEALESDGVLGAYLSCQLADELQDEQARRISLDRAVFRAPFLRRPRIMRLACALNTGDLKTARADAEHLESACSGADYRVQACFEVGEAFLKAGYREDALIWLKRAMVLSPNNADVMILIAEALLSAGEANRAAELLSSVSRQIGGGDTANREEVEPHLRDKRRNMRAHANLLLAGIFSEHHGDAVAALSHLASIETRTESGASARLLEAEIYERQANRRGLTRAVQRLLEAVEMEWVSLGPHRLRFNGLLERVESELEPALMEFAQRVLKHEERDRS